MWRQAKIKPYREYDFFADRNGSRPLVPGTVAQGKMKTEDPIFFTGKGADNKPVKTIPVKAVKSFVSPKAMLERGKDRYTAYCYPCHGAVGNGNGFIMQRGLGYWQKLASSYHTERLRKIEDGHIYDVITNGHGVMYGYASRIQDVNDRWAVVAYVRALQLAQSGTLLSATSAVPAPEATPTPATRPGATRPGNVPPGPRVSPSPTATLAPAEAPVPSVTPGATPTPAPEAEPTPAGGNN
jgi:mono/diheme cytochrome c family protein